MYKYFTQTTPKVFSYMRGIKCGLATFMANHRLTTWIIKLWCSYINTLTITT